MKITTTIFEAYLRCPTKSYLYSQSVQYTDIVPHQSNDLDSFVRAVSESLQSSLQLDEYYIGTPVLQTLSERRYRLILDYTVDRSDIHARIHALQLVLAPDGKCQTYIPVRFIPTVKLTKLDKLLLAFDAIAWFRASGEMPQIGRIIHGDSYAVLKVDLPPLVDQVYAVFAEIGAQQNHSVPPPLVLNPHCSDCEFQSRCRQLAVEKDDLSLLTNMSANERAKLNEKGIFTVTQLSYTFRARKAMPVKHYHSLKALAIRKKQIHILGTPSFAVPGTAVYLDVEGNLDRRFYYLIGLRYLSGSSPIQHSFWADDLSQERMIWSSCLNVLAQIDKPILIHYGAYETQFLKTMRQRYSDLLSGPYVDQLIASSVNVLSFTYDRVYFPTYSNSLKEIAGYLGFQWSESSASGRKAMSWRSTWESLRDPEIKQKLLTYNVEDCAALQKISELILSLTSDDAPPTNMEPAKVALDTAEYPHQFGEVNFVVPAFSQINKAAYWDYQRNKVYVRSSRRLKRLAATRDNSVPSRTMPANKIIYIQDERPAVCRRCENTLIYKTGRFSQTVHDIRISDSGLKRWVVRYRYDRYLCWNCKASFNQYERQGKWGLHLKAYVIYQLIELRISMPAIGRSLQSLFGFDIRTGAIHLMKSQAAERYGVTYQGILHRLASGKLVHADETKVTICDETHYIWVFTNLEEVAFVHSESRDASTAKEVLKGFQGVLVSDFYAGYDSIDCAQQKCLVHLMRDINDDLRAHPFDEELKEFGQDFALLLKPMIDTIDRFGLKTHHLRKHRSVSDEFYRTLSQKDYTSEVATSYKKRFEKNRNKLFTFLDYDGVPWNNNNAEHAIKAFARLRKNLGAKSSIKGMRDYLVLLSISETCQYKGVSFLHFLMSGEMDIDRCRK